MAQGFAQMSGFDFQKIFRHVVKPMTIKVVIIFALSMEWKLYKLDITMPF